MAIDIDRLNAALAGQYMVEREIGRGGMAIVYLATDLKHDRRVAIKVLHPELTATIGSARFLREIELAASLEHPHILSIHDSGEADGLLYYVMPYVDGESLHERLTSAGVLPVVEAVRIASEVADGLEYAHLHGVIHRDIKPGNILLADEHARIADFGVARSVGDEHTTKTGIALGSPVYMSPEQAAGAEVDSRTDIYSLGCVIYEMLAGEPPFGGATPQAIQAHRLTDTPTPLPLLRETVPPALDSVVRKALARLPADRHESARDLGDALRSGLDGLEVIEVKPAKRRGAWRSKRTLLVGLITALLLLTLLWAGRDWFPASRSSVAVDLDPTRVAVFPFRAATSSPLAHLGRDVPEQFNTKLTEVFDQSVDPGMLLSLWAREGGSPDIPLPAEEMIELAAETRAGRLVRGAVVGDTIVTILRASLIQVPEATVLASAEVEGAYTEWPSLVEELFIRLLASEVGVGSWRVPQLLSHDSKAAMAYLKAVGALRSSVPMQDDWWDSRREARSLFFEAFSQDSTFVLAALGVLETPGWNRETDALIARLVLEGRERLTSQDQAIADLFIAESLPDSARTKTAHDMVRLAKEVTLVVPEWADAWAAYSEVLVTWGALAGVPFWRSRSLSALSQLLYRDSTSLPPILSALELAVSGGDQEKSARYYALLEATYPQVASLPDYEWPVAIVTGNSIARSHALERMQRIQRSDYEISQPDGTVSRVRPRTTALEGMAGWAVSLGSGLKALESHEDALQRLNLNPAYSYIRGRLPEDAASVHEPTEDVARESAVRRAADPTVLALLADRIGLLEMASQDSLPQPDSLFASVVCWSTLLRLNKADTRDAETAISLLRREGGEVSGSSLCAFLLEALQTWIAGQETESTVAQLDSVMRPYPLSDYGAAIREVAFLKAVANLVLARMLSEAGDLEGALAASRRRTWRCMLDLECALLVEFLREEARLAAMTGDTLKAIGGYQHYLALRDEPPDHPPWRAQWDSVRTELAELTGTK